VAEVAVLDPRIPEKQYFRIGEVAEIAGVESYVLRFWETEFKDLRPDKSRSGHRLYSRDDVVLVLRIRDLLYEDGFTIPGARKNLKRRIARASGSMDPSEGPDNPMSARTRALLSKVRKEVEDLLQVLEE
jgi:DNA-binding transcriptional MerR regulator